MKNQTPLSKEVIGSEQLHSTPLHSRFSHNKYPWNNNRKKKSQPDYIQYTIEHAYFDLLKKKKIQHENELLSTS